MAKQRQNIKSYIFDKRGRVLSIGSNSYISSTRLQRYHARKTGNPEKIYLHSEVDAISRCVNLNKAHRILVVRIGTNGEYLLSKPCEVCMSAIEATPIRIVQWSENGYCEHDLSI